jgi:LytS/YehU family sensor histidine kinase
LDSTIFDKTCIMEFLKKYKFTFIGIGLGLIGGYAYYYFIGCASGTCAITSKPLNSSLYGGMMGGLLLNMLDGRKKKAVDKE